MFDRGSIKKLMEDSGAGFATKDAVNGLISYLNRMAKDKSTMNYYKMNYLMNYKILKIFTIYTFYNHY